MSDVQTSVTQAVQARAAMTGRLPVPQMTLFRTWLHKTAGLSFDDYNAMWRWSVTDLDAFWRSIWDYHAIESATPFDRVLEVEQMPGATWFKGAQVNYARQVFRHVDAAEAAGQPAIIGENESGEIREIGWPELRRQAFALAVTLREFGVGPGDRVAAYLPNIPEAVIAFLACSSLGAVWSMCAPDMGFQAVLDRFSQIEPKVLIAVDGVRYAGKSLDRGALVEQLQVGLPTLEATVIIRTPHATTHLAAALDFDEAVSRGDEQVTSFKPAWLGFDHPIWILYSSGTTGLPKPIVHGQGGTLLAAMSNGKHNDLGASYTENNHGERFHWFTSTGWVMWNAQVEGLLSGTTICLYDGSPSGPKEHPDWSILWRFAARHKVTFLGAGAAFYTNCMKAGLDLAGCGDLSAVRALGSTGSPLPEEVQLWGVRQFEAIGTADIWWFNVSGGTDLIGAFCTGNRELPLVPGRMQCRQLGAAVEAWNDAGEPVVEGVGELVCIRPTPGMPLYFWGDQDDRRCRSSYFERFDGVWCHGDWIEVKDDGSCVIYGRSDATVNRHGVRMGTSEIYAAVESLPEVLDSIVLDLQYLGQDSALVLFVVLREGAHLDDAIVARINEAVRSALSPRFLPDEVIQAPAIPRTLSGKKQEIPLKRIFQGHDPSTVINRDVMANPEVIEWYVAHQIKHK